jgi:hypothetical protein
MDITKFVVDFREAAFLLGDHATYHAQCSRRLRIVQKKLGRATPKNAKYAAKAHVTVADIAKDHEYAIMSKVWATADRAGISTCCCSPRSVRGRRPWP